MLFTFDGKSPQVHPSAYVAPTATIIGDVIVAAGASIWFGAVLRGDAGRIVVGSNSNVQDGAVVHEETAIGEGCTLAHLVLVHRAHLGRDVLIGNGALVYGDVTVGDGAMVGAGAVASGPLSIPAGTLWLGVPARQIREVDDRLRGVSLASRDHYVELRARYLAGLTPADAAAERYLRDHT